MQKLLLGIDRISTVVGQAASWLIVGLTLMISYEVFSRYALGTPHAWVFDASNMLYGALFMLGGAYTLAKRGHVRGDILYGFLAPRAAAAATFAGLSSTKNSRCGGRPMRSSAIA